MQRPEESPALPQAPLSSPRAAVPVLVLNVGKMVLHHGSVGIIRSLGRMGVPVYAIVEDRFTPAAVSRYLTGAFVWDTRDLDARRFLEGMEAIGHRLKRPTVVIPTGDLGSALVAENAAALRRWFVFPEQPPQLPRTLANKRELDRLCRRLGVPCALTEFPESRDEVHRFAARATFPVMAKSAESWLLPAGTRTSWIARTPAQLDALYEATQTQGHSNLLLQEFIDPAGGEDWFYHGYRNARSNCCLGFTGRKLRSYPVHAGPTTLGKAISNEGLRQKVERLLQVLSFSGICDLDFRLDTRDGKYKLLDFNPRIGAQFRLLEDEAGVDVARALYLDLTGQRVPASRPVEGRTFIAEFHDLAASLGYFRQGRLSPREWWRSLQGRRELAWFSRDDLVPFGMMIARLLLRVGQRLLRLRVAPPVMDAPPRYVRCRAARSNQVPGGSRP
jgi:predicted ATP-grasp superfamily ATP-dependent carboligase